MDRGGGITLESENNHERVDGRIKDGHGSGHPSKGSHERIDSA